MQPLPANFTSIGTSIQNEQMRSLFKQVETAMKSIQLNGGDFLYFSDKNYRIKISPYRMTMEMRFPDGIARAEN